MSEHGQHKGFRQTQNPDSQILRTQKSYTLNPKPQNPKKPLTLNPKPQKAYTLNPSRLHPKPRALNNGLEI